MNLRKKIVLIDTKCEIFESIYKSDKIEIDILIVNEKFYTKDFINKYKSVQIFSTEKFYDFILSQDINLDYELLNKFKTTQLKVEHYYSRITSDINSLQYLFSLALSFWNEKFKNNEIGGVILNRLEHGTIFDLLPLDVAKYYNIPAYIFHPTLTDFENKRANAILNYNVKEHIKIDTKKYGLKNIKKENFIYYKDLHELEKKDKVSFKKKIKEILESIGGAVLVMFFSRLITRKKNISNTFERSYWKYFSRNIYIKNLKRYYDSLCFPFDDSCNYIYYTLHLEPEASIQVNTIFYNQLAIIKTISQNLPEGWVLYVKEHPHQYNLNNNTMSYFMPTIDKFRTKRFYDEIVRMENTKLIKAEIPSIKVLENSKASATLNGTIILESIVKNKPVLAFSQKTSLFTKVNGVFDIANNEECKKALEKISTGFIPLYDNLDEVLIDYHYEVDDKSKFDFKELIEKLFINKDSNC